MADINVSIEEAQPINVTVTEAQPINVSIGESVYIEGTTDHSQLTNLDYDDSGHTGFATAAQGLLADTALQSETDPIFTASEAANITATDIENLGNLDTAAYKPVTAFEPTLPATPTEPETKYLNGNRQWSAVSIAGNGSAASIYATNVTSTIVGTYKQSSYTNDVAETSVATTANNNEVLAMAYLFDGQVNTTTIDAGLWTANMYAAIDAAAGDTYLKFETYKRSDAGVETILFSGYSPTIENRVGYEGYQRILIESHQPSFTVDPTDRLGTKIYVKTTAAGNRTVTYKVGDGNASYFTSPLALRHPQLRDKNGEAEFQHMTAAEKTAVGTIGGKLNINQTTPQTTVGTFTFPQIITPGTILFDGSNRDIITRNNGGAWPATAILSTAFSATTGDYLKFGVAGSAANAAVMVLTRLNLLGIGTITPTHTITLPSGATGIAAYNTSDQTTNYERLVHYKSSNVYNIESQSAGSGVARPISIGGASGKFTVQPDGVILPRQATTAAAPAYVKGGMYFDTTLNKMRIGGASGWETITSV